MAETTDPEAARRFSSHESLEQEVCALVKEEAQTRGLALLRIDVRPAWSHEYDEHTGVAKEELSARTLSRLDIH